MEAVALLDRSLLGLRGGFRGAVRVEHGDSVLLDSAYGTDGVGVELRPSTAFQIASVTKTFTAATMVALADEGLLSLDDQLPTWIEGAPRTWSQISIRHLLTHTSGLPHWDGVPSLDNYSRCERAALISQIAAAPLRFPPGANWSYSSLGFILLAHIAETASQRPWALLVTERLLQPINLSQTAVAIPPESTAAAHGSKAGEATPSVELATVNIGTGDIWSNTSDLSRWPRALAASKVLRPRSREQMLAPQARIADEDDGLTDIAYGYGWFTASLADVRLLFHPGDQAGFSSLLLWAPEPDLSIALLCADELQLGPIALPALERLLRETRQP